MAASRLREAGYYTWDFGPLRFKGIKKDETLKEVYIESRKVDEIQDQTIKSTTIMSYRPIKGSIIEDIIG